TQADVGQVGLVHLRGHNEAVGEDEELIGAGHGLAGLDLAVDDLAAGRAISLEAVTAAARPPLPIWLFAKAGNMMVRKKIRSLRKSGTDPDARPFAEERIGQD
ncbi:MAG TPA: hypothetical protein PLD82_10355, partial [Spirochaetota bacterium]|nr:hypothetical protein [Spirochaetota bacterium]